MAEANTVSMQFLVAPRFEVATACANRSIDLLAMHLLAHFGQNKRKASPASLVKANGVTK